MIININQKMFCHYCGKQIISPDPFVLISRCIPGKPFKNSITREITKDFDPAHFSCVLRLQMGLGI